MSRNWSENFYTIDEAGEILSVCRRTIRRHIKLGKLERVLTFRKNSRGQNRKQVDVTKTSVVAFLEKQKVKNQETENHTPIKDARGLVIANWNRFYRPLLKHLGENGLMEDLEQALELTTLEAAQCKSVGLAGKVIGREIRAFLKSIGLVKIHGRYTKRDRLYPDEWWEVLHKREVVKRDGIYCSY